VKNKNRISRMYRAIGPWILLLAWQVVFLQLTGCVKTRIQAPLDREPILVKLDPARNPSFFDDMDYEGLTESLDRIIDHLKRIPLDREFTFGEDRYDTRHLLKSMERFKEFIQTRPPGNALNQFIRDYYRVYRSGGSKDPNPVLFTGYFEPEIPGSPVETYRYRHPVLSRPNDLILIDPAFFPPEEKNKTHAGRLRGNLLVPYADRREILADASFVTKAKPLAWVEDPVALFFLHVQGSGKIRFENLDFIRVQYDISNGRPYRSIGKYLIEQGKISASEMSMQAIEAYLKDHPEEIHNVLDFNPSYVFFRQADEGPMGCLNTKLIPGRAIASDRTVFPMPALAFIETWKPRLDGHGRIDTWIPFSRFVLNQDTGGAIKGPGRIDVFWGNGPYAEKAAGHMKHKGNLYFLVLEP
jgi:membrane-bound lytic murein transglycosylase A